jgi:hypothetical protein
MLVNGLVTVGVAMLPMLVTVKRRFLCFAGFVET